MYKTNILTTQGEIVGGVISNDGVHYHGELSHTFCDQLPYGPLRPVHSRFISTGESEGNAIGYFVVSPLFLLTC